jgi:hypothetical protein
MGKRFLLSLLTIILFFSCEKIIDKPYELRYYGDAYEDIGNSVLITNDGYVIAGMLSRIIRQDGNYIESWNSDMGIIKTGWDGNVLWKRSLGGKYNDTGSKIYQLEDGSLICTGTFTDTTKTVPGQTDVFVVKVSASGELLWQKTYGGSGNQTGKDIIKIPDGFMVLGSTDNERQPLTDSTGNIQGNSDIYLLKISDNGDFIDSFAYGFPGNDLPAVIKPDAGGDYVILGTTDRSDPLQDKNNLILIKINYAGSATEPRIIGGTADEYASDLEVLPDGYLMAGTIGKEDEPQKIYIAKLTRNIYDDPLVPNLFNDATSRSVKAIFPYNGDSFLVAGQVGQGSASDMLVFEMDANGNPVAGHQMIRGSTGVQVANDVVSGDDGYIIAVGKNSYDVNSMICFLKFRF